VWRRRAEPVLDRETLDGIIRKLMAIDAKLALLLDHFGLSTDDGAKHDDP
jgi:hypothetical protein